MRTQSIITVFTILLIISGILSAGTLPQGERTKSFSVKSGGELIVSVNPGDISVSTWDKDEVYVIVKGLDEDELDEVEMEQFGNRVSVRYSSDWGWSDDGKFLINIPINFHVKCNTTGGDIEIKGNVVGRVAVRTSGGDINTGNVQGELDVSTSGGDIRIGDVNGKLSVDTQGGDIRIGVVKGKPARVNTMGGDIDIKSVESDLSAKTYGGDITTDFVGGNADVTTYGGDLKLRNVTGSARMETYGGDIILDGSEGRVDVETKGGDIKLTNIKGIIDAKTSAGDIQADLIPSGKGDSYLSSAHGKVDLRIPSSAKVTIEAIIKIRGGGWRSYDEDDYDIRSDFKSTTYNKDDGDIIATYEINGGGQKIKIRTVNSDIRIRKMN